MRKLPIIIVIFLIFVFAVRAERVKDIVDIQGVRGNPLSGIGLVVGLADTGDSTLPSRQMLTNIMRNSGLVFTPEDLSGGNIAIVMVTAELSPFGREGSKIDVMVSSMEDAKSLQGGMLLPAPLKGLDGNVYAVAQGSVSIGGWAATGAAASATKSHQTVGRIPGGATIERAELATFIEKVVDQRFVTLNLRNADFATADRISTGVNVLYPQSATVKDAGTIRIGIPRNIPNDRIVSFIDQVTSLEVKVDMPAVVVINERTGTIVVGENVGISAVAIAQGSLMVRVKESALVSQPIAPFSDAGTTEVIPDTSLEVFEGNGHLIPIPKTTNVANLSRLLNSIGASPTDLIAIFNALKQQGALQARLEIM
ncbi:MAG: flagellar basal body P-ring protein FlgI [Anaerohalosphaera sp.]|nr:flagellar basal body P-ring protein FlgI [Anaerohalosphaera sp.]